ncbi:hypothetical protein LAZ67_18000514 [Cordylochernes scorpioides]|uniref:Uncharacterized protein n=1 Tax=Cordylochernes scorpioides TaxID=51811 RepID=A0ABY6LFV3_9ARAC|nr:hypothetical protein LAZ67_18000514 [Cordylochernes scorpioides]
MAIRELHKTKASDHHLPPQITKTFNLHVAWSLTIDKLVHCLEIIHGSAYQIIHNLLGYARCVTKQLTQFHKKHRLDIGLKHLDCYDNELDIFLNRIVTGDEAWIHHFEPESKR